MSDESQNQDETSEETSEASAAENSEQTAGGEETPACQSATSEEPRRNFMVEFAAGVIGALVGAVPALAGVFFFLDPLIRKREEGGGDGFINLKVNVDALPEDGTPQSFTVFADKVDAWNKFLNQPIGSVWLRKTESGEVLAFNTICPHLGCSVDYRQGETDFFCPCHTSAFNLDGEKQNEIPPRGMDKLEIETRGDKNEIWVKYQNFRAAEKEQIPV